VTARAGRAAAGRRALGLAALLVTAAVAERRASACAACACGDPTLTAMGSEKPVRNRLRLAWEGRHRSDIVGHSRADEIRLRELRSDLRLAFAPHERLFLMATVPFVRREVTYVNLARATQTGLADTELRAKLFLYQDRGFAARHLIAALVGVKLPTTPAARQPDGSLLPSELQPGTGSFDPQLGISYAHFTPPWSFYASVTGTLTTTGRNDTRASRSVAGTIAGQRQWSAVGVRLSVDVRADGVGREQGEREADSGGVIAFAGPELLFSPATDLLLVAGGKLPVWNGLRGRHDEGPLLSLGVAYDF
jgi:hypothetical protein